MACETSCSSLWSLLLGHSWLSSCYRLICRVLYYPNRGAEVRALLTDAQRARVLTLAVVDLSFALSMLPQPPELLPLLVLSGKGMGNMCGRRAPRGNAAAAPSAWPARLWSPTSGARWARLGF